MEQNQPPRQVSLEVFDWHPDEQDKDANFKGEVAAYSQVDPPADLDQGLYFDLEPGRRHAGGNS